MFPVKTALTLLAIFLPFSTYALDVDEVEDRQKKFSAGIIVGEPVGITGKAWLRKSRAVDMGIAYSFDNFLLIYSDYLWQHHGVFGGSASFGSRLILYYGAGAAIGFSSTSATTVEDEAFYLRVPVGIEWFRRRFPLSISLEVIPSLSLVPDVGVKIFGGLALRYYFN